MKKVVMLLVLSFVLSCIFGIPYMTPQPRAYNFYSISGQAWGSTENDHTATHKQDGIYFAGNVSSTDNDTWTIVRLNFSVDKIKEVHYRFVYTAESGAYCNYELVIGETIVESGDLSPGETIKNWTGPVQGDTVEIRVSFQGPGEYLWAGIDYAYGVDANLTVYSGSVAEGTSESTLECDGDELVVRGEPFNFSITRWCNQTGIVRADVCMATNVTTQVSMWNQSVFTDTNVTFYTWRETAECVNITFMQSATGIGEIAIDCITFASVQVELKTEKVYTSSRVEIIISASDMLNFTLVLFRDANGSTNIVGRADVKTGSNIIRINQSGDYRVVLYYAGEHYIDEAEFTVSLPPLWEYHEVDWSPVYIACGVSVAALGTAAFLSRGGKRGGRK